MTLSGEIPVVSGDGPSRARSWSGMGAVTHAEGVTFRVWAPFATGVSVAGSFNGWSADSHPLSPEGGGCGPSMSTVCRRVSSTSSSSRPRGVLWRNDPYARAMTHSAGNSIVCAPEFDWGDTPFEMPSWDDLVIYELHVGTFNDAPRRSGLAASTAWSGGSDYLRDLGVNAIELMPSAEFGHDFSWGYNPAHIFAIEEAYGGPRALKELIRAAHAHGIAVICDVVFNHLGPTDLDLWRFDGWSENDKGGIYFYNDCRSRRRGATPAPTTGARRCATSCATTPGCGSRSSASTGCAGTPPPTSATSTATTTIRPTTCPMAGGCASDHRRNRRSANRGSSTSPRISATTPG